MLALLLLAQLAAPVAARGPAYSTAALRELVARAAAANRAPPAELRGYRAHVETELSLLLRDTLGRERAPQIEQLASEVRWRRGDSYDMRVVGYRAQGVGVPYSSLSFVRGWTEPSLYGERLRLGAQLGAARDRVPGESTPDSIVAVHPLGADRDAYYSFSGGDTVTVLRPAGRSIPIVRVHVTPRLRDSARFAAFDGELDLDATRQQIVRMRGQFVILGKPARGARLMSRLPGMVAVAYCEFTNSEVGGRYWLPATQRTELQSSFILLGRSRAVMRIVSRFSGYQVDDSGRAALAPDDVRRIAHRTTWAPPDSVNAFAGWDAPLGSATTSVAASDFDDIAPDAWRQTGGVHADLLPTRMENVLRFNRVEGLYTGLEASVRMRSVVPGLAAGAMGGWAWRERTVRGGARVQLARGGTTYGVRGERALVSTNDFVRQLEQQTGGLDALLGSDDFDYLDRRLALASVTHLLGSLERGLVTLQAGMARDGAEPARLARGLFGSRDFRANRGIAEGSYALAVVDVEWHPNVSGDFVERGVGWRLRHEAAQGTLRWQRTELSLSGRGAWGPVVLAAHADVGGAFGGALPPQQLFELGGRGTLPGYGYKEFAGDRAALFRGYGSYTFSVARTPIRIWRNFYLPGLAPGVAAGLQGGWTTLATEAARSAALALGRVPDGGPLSRATGVVRATAGVGLTLFNGNAHLGVAHPLDHPGPWKLAAGLGQEF